MKKLLLVSLCFLLLCTQQIFAQNRTISGTVTSKDDGLPLPGVSVAVTGTTIGTQTNGNGHFSLSVPASAKTLRVSFLGYTAQQVAIGASTTVNVALVSSRTDLSEVVVVGIGYQTIRKKDLTGALSVVDSAKFTEKPLSAFTQMLQGTAPGVQVTTGSGRPSDNGVIRVRGTGSVSASSDPLIVLDGIQITSSAYNALNPDDIENVTVLKDASAVAIFGSRGANGVILVTTKTGKPGQPSVRYSFRYGKSDRQPLQNARMMTSQEKFQYEYDAKYTNPILDTMISARYGAGNDITSITPAQRQTVWDLAASRGAGDWSKYLFQNAVNRNHEVSLSGGADKLTYFLSGSLADNAGVERFSGFNKKGGRLNVTYQAKDWLKIGTNLAVTTSHEDRVREAYNTQNSFAAMFFFNPYEPVYLANGQFNPSFQGFSPLEGAINNPVDYDRVNDFATVFGEAKFFKHLTLKSQYAANYNTLNYQSYLQPGSNLASILGYNQKQDQIQQDYFYSFVNTATWIQSVGKHSFNALIGNEYDYDNLYTLSATGRGLPSKSFTTLENAATPTQASTSRVEYSLISYFGSLNYNYDQRYFLTVSGRRDGSSRFGANVRFANFGAIGLAWDLKNEKFMTLPSIFSELKLRGSFGTAGNNTIPNYLALGTYSTSSKYNDQTSAVPSNLVNPNLTWETSYTKDLGLTWGLFGGRLTGEFDYYNRENKNLLYPVNVSQTTGFSSYYGNVGAVRNRGIDIGINGTVIRKKGLKWDLNFQYSHVANKMTQLYSDNAGGVSNTFGFQKLVLGQPINVYYMVEDGGINTANGKQMYRNLDGTLTDAYAGSQSKVLNGKSPNITYFGSFGTTLSYKGIDFSAMFYYSGGNYIYNTVWQDMTSSSDYNTGLFASAADYWKPSNTGAKFPRLLDPTTGQIDPTQQAENYTTKYLEKGDYLSLRDVTLGYTLPSQYVKKLGIAGVRVFTQGTNLAIWTKFHGNPETGSSGETTAYTGSNYQYGYPPVRVWTLGVDVRF